MKYNPYSASKISTYIDCPRKFKYSHIDKIKQEEKIYFEKGKLCHSILESLFLKTPVQVNKPFKFLNKKDITNSIINCKRVFKDYSRYINVQLIEDINIELKIETNILKGYLDFVGFDPCHNAYILDWKTGSNLDKQIKYPKSSFQLDFYAYLIFKTYENINDIFARYVFLDFDYYEEHIYNRKEFVWFEDVLKNNIKIIETDTEFLPNMTKLCEYCDYKNLCFGV